MKLTNLKQTLLTCINYHELKGNLTRAQQLRDKLKEVDSERIEDEKRDNLYK